MVHHHGALHQQICIRKAGSIAIMNIEVFQRYSYIAHT